MIFISHSNHDADFVQSLRIQLESFGLDVYVDRRRLTGGDNPESEIEQAINEACYFLAVLSPKTVNSRWVRKEISQALARQQQNAAFKVIPLLLAGMETAALGAWFDDEPLAIALKDHDNALLEALPQILSALGEQAPDKVVEIEELEEQPLEELILELEEPEIKNPDDGQQLTAKAKLVYEPATKGKRRIVSSKFRFTAPLGEIELYDLRWYLEDYQVWPAGEFKKRAEKINANLPLWGKLLYNAALNHETARDLAKQWRQADGQRRFSVLIDDEALDEDEKPQVLEAANALWALPWELLHDDLGYIAEGKQGGRVRRRLPNRRDLKAFTLDLPIKVLLVSPRPLDTGYIDHRITAKPLVQALQALGDLVAVTILNPPTLQALQAILGKKEFHVVHFDGHGVYDKHKGLGGLCFEQAAQVPKRGELDLVYADKLAAMLREHRIPLVFLEACQTAQSENDAIKSVAAALLDAGIVSVVAMTHSVLVVTAELFVRKFYSALAKGERIGEAMLAGQRALMSDKARFDEGIGDGFFIEDWFVPVLYQEREDPPLFHRVLPQRLQALQAKQRRLALGALPDAPPHQFIGRSQELLALERLLQESNYAVITGQGGAGKTTLAVELARWLVESRRVAKAAFVCLEHLTETRAVLDSIGRQLLSDKFTVAGDEKGAYQLVERALRDDSCLIVLDNCESLLPDKDGKPPLAAIDLYEFLGFCQSLQQAGARLLFTSRDALPPPFASSSALGALAEFEAIALLKNVLQQAGQDLPADVGEKQRWLTEFVKALNGHARALVLVAPLAAAKGFKVAATDLAQIMDELHQQNPDSRELSLYASLAVSLRRLSPQHRQWSNALAVFNKGFHLMVLIKILEIDDSDMQNFINALVHIGVIEYPNDTYFSLNPALSSYLKTQMPDNDYISLQQRWLNAMQAFVHFLYQQFFQNIQLAAQATSLDLSNLLAMLTILVKQKNVEQTAIIAGELEQLLKNQQQSKALYLVRKIRKEAINSLSSNWNHRQFVSKTLNIEQLIENGFSGISRGRNSNHSASICKRWPNRA